MTTARYQPSPYTKKHEEKPYLREIIVRVQDKHTQCVFEVSVKFDLDDDRETLQNGIHEAIDKLCDAMFKPVSKEASESV